MSDGSFGDRDLISKKCRVKDDDDFGAPENLSPLFAAGEPVSIDSWTQRRASIRSLWLETLGYPTEPNTGGLPEKIGEFFRPECVGSIYRQPTIGGATALMVLLEPKNEVYAKAPGAIAHRFRHLGEGV